MNLASPRMQRDSVGKGPIAPRVLIAEDSLLIAMELENILNDCGCVLAQICCTAEDAIKLIDRKGCDFAVVDYWLADGTAEALVDALRRKSIPFMLCTGQSENEIAPALNGVPVVSKPYAIEDVQNAVLQLMSKMGAQN